MKEIVHLELKEEDASLLRQLGHTMLTIRRKLNT